MAFEPAGLSGAAMPLPTEWEIIDDYLSAITVFVELGTGALRPGKPQTFGEGNPHSEGVLKTKAVVWHAPWARAGEAPVFGGEAGAAHTRPRGASARRSRTPCFSSCSRS